MAQTTKRGTAMLSVDTFHIRGSKQGVTNVNNVCNILKRFRRLKFEAIPLVCPKSFYKHRVTWSHHSSTESVRWSESTLWRHQWCSFRFVSHADDVKREIRCYISRLLTAWWKPLVMSHLQRATNTKPRPVHNGRRIKIHDGVIKWKHFPRYWPFVRGIHPSSGNSPHKGQWRGA